jgi:protein-L-isoaspartate O-methyltransferase
MLGQASLSAGDNVLEIGAGTGWNSALMGHIVGSKGTVTTIDLDSDTAAFARENQARAGVSNVEVICGDGGLGFEARAPYDGMIVTAQMPDVTPHLVRQLCPGARLVVPQWFNTLEFSAAYEKVDDVREMLVNQSVSRCGFMPLRGEFSGPIQRLYRSNLWVQMRSDLQLDLDVVQVMLATVPRQYEVSASMSDLNDRFLEYAALTGEPLAKFCIGADSKYSYPHCFFTSDTSFVLLEATWDDEKEARVLSPELSVYGDDAALTRLEKVVAQWVADGRPGLDDAKIVVAPAKSLEQEAGKYLSRKQWMDYQVSFHAS